MERIVFNREGAITLLKKFKSISALANFLEISRQGLYKKLEKLRIKKPKEIIGFRTNPIVKCNYCGKVFQFKYASRNQKRFWCSPECKKNDLYIKLKCKVCGKDYYVRRKLFNVRYKGITCSKKCWGYLLGKSNKNKKRRRKNEQKEIRLKIGTKDRKNS